jgi:protein-S-isoprenylcysteine O-methyltransferase Ste14
MKIRIKIQGALMFLGLAAIILLSSSVFPHARQKGMDEALSAIGMGIILFGFLFRISARGYKEEKSSNGNVLVKDGPYAVIRNPMYFGTFTIGVGVIVMLLELWILLVFAIIFLIIYIPQMRREEKLLMGRFGEEYKEYCRRTPKYLPRPDYLLRINKYISLKPFWVRKEMFSMIPTIVIVLLMEIWEQIR